MPDPTLGAYTRHEKHDAPVRGCPNPDQHTIATLPSAFAAATPCSCSVQRARAEKAEESATYWENTSRAQTGALQRAQARADAAESRPLTPDAITDEMVERALTKYEGELLAHQDCDEWMRDFLTAALTEPNEDPEVVALAEVLSDFAVADEHNGTRDDMQLARLLHGRGVRRVVGDE